MTQWAAHRPCDIAAGRRTARRYRRSLVDVTERRRRRRSPTVPLDVDRRHCCHGATSRSAPTRPGSVRQSSRVQRQICSLKIERSATQHTDADHYQLIVCLQTGDQLTVSLHAAVTGVR